MPVLSPKRQITLPKTLCDRLEVLPGDDLDIFEYKGLITILKKSKDRSAGVLKHLKADARISERASLQDSLEVRQRKVGAKRRAG
jgi:bifunctional DNA-binding transcriptional regulator/antitoxin component of YhaV-PrlF toxin-antitoxin module